MFGFNGISLILVIIGLFYGIVTISMPFYVRRIRHEAIEANKKLTRIIELLKQKNAL